MFTRILALSLILLGSAAAQTSNAVQAVVLGARAIQEAKGKSGTVDLQFNTARLVHGPYTLTVYDPDGAAGKISVNGAPLFQDQRVGERESTTVTLAATNTLSVDFTEDYGGTIWISISGWEYEFAPNYASLPSYRVSPTQYPNGTLDWRTKGAVTPVKNQGDTCSSSWAFSTTGVIEGYVQIRNGVLRSLSEQELIDCSGDRSCDLGSTPQSLKYVEKNGLAAEASYPYTARQGSCKNAIPSTFSQITGATRGPIGDEDSLGAMVDAAPVAAVINGNWFAGYTGGVATPDCDAQAPSYSSVLIVGYGYDSTSSLNYWLVKNSLGSSWGEQGYFRIARNLDACGIADYTLSVN